MKIIQIIQRPQLRGAEIFACQLADSLQKMNVEIIVISLFKGEASLPFSGRIIHLNLSSKKRLFDWQGWKTLAKIMNDEKPDIVQANAGDTLKYAVLSKFIFQWKSKIVFRNASTVSLYIKNSIVKTWNAWLYSCTDHIISVSSYTRADLQRLFPKVNNRITVVPIGIMAKKVTEHTITNHKKTLLHIGGFTFEKNHEGIIRIFESLKVRHPEIVLWLVGDGPLRNSIEELVKEKGLGDSVKFWGYQADPFKFYSACDIFLLPSIIEGLPAVVIEAFYCKIPVVAYNVGGISDLVKPGETGFLIEKGNEKAFAIAVEEILGEKMKRERMIENAHKLVCEKYTLEYVAHQFLEVYNTICNKEA